MNEDLKRRINNRESAIMLAKQGVAVFPSSGKTPLVPAFNKLDSDITPQERAAAIEEWQERHGKFVLDKDGRPVIEKGTKTPKPNLPVHVGCTKSPEVVLKMWRRFKDAVPSIACGPSGLIVLDADKKDDGPAKLAALAEENGGWPERTLILNTQSGGNHIYFRQPGDMGNRAGALKRDFGTDVRGKGGQTVAPGSIREDGKTYGSKEDLLKFLALFTHDAIPELPSWVVEKIGEAREGEVTLADGDAHVRNLIERLGANEWPDFETAFDETVGHSLKWLRECEPDFVKLHDDPTSDRSSNRFRAARYLAGAFPGMQVEDFAAYCEAWEGAGEPDHRQLAREWAKAKLAPYPVYMPSNGSAFGDVSNSEGGDVVAPGSKNLAFEFESDVAANATLPDWLVEGIIEASTLCAFYGAPNSGKSLVVLDVLYSVASGQPWRERDVKQGSVLFISVEGPNGTARRAKAWREYHGIKGGVRLPLAFIRTGVNLFNDPTSAKKIVRAVKRLEKETGLPCRAVAIDTVAATTPGMGENNPEDWGVFLGNLRTVMRGTNSAILPVHHTGKDESRGMRGHTSFLGAVDSTILVSNGTVATVKMRDGQSGQKFPFAIKILNLWTDEKGRPVGAPVAVAPERGAALGPVDDEDEAPTLVQPDRREDRERNVVEVFDVEAMRQKASDESLSSARARIELSAKEIWVGVSKIRKGNRHEELSRSTVADHIRACVESGRLEVVGTKALPRYRLT